MWLSKRQEVKPQLDLTRVTVSPITGAVVFNRFDCGVAALNKFIKNKALKASIRHEFRVYVAQLEGSANCLGYYALQIGSDTIPEKYKAGKQSYISNYSAFPAINLSFLAVTTDFQRRKLGEFLFMDILEKVAAVSENVGFYALTLQSYDDKSTAFYHSLGFEEYSEGGGQPKLLYPLVNILKLLGK
jgi:hypothetical protein